MPHLRRDLANLIDYYAAVLVEAGSEFEVPIPEATERHGLYAHAEIARSYMCRGRQVYLAVCHLLQPLHNEMGFACTREPSNHDAPRPVHHPV